MIRRSDAGHTSRLGLADPVPRAGNGNGNGNGPAALLAVPDYLGTLAAVRALGRAGVVVHLADDSRFTPASWSRFTSRVYRGPALDGEPHRFLDWLLALGARAPGRVLLPTSDELTWLFAQHRTELEQHFLLDVPEPGVAQVLLNKWRLRRACQEVGIDTPESALPEKDGELRGLARDIGFPLLIKPQTQAFLRLHHKGIVVESPDELEDRYAGFRAALQYAPMVLASDPGIVQPILQRFVEGASERIYNLSGYVDKSGEIFVRQASFKLLQKPRRVGVGICFEEAEVDEGLAAKLAALCRHVRYHGVFEAEYLESEGRRLLIDFNPRFYGQMGFDVARGVNVPLLAYLAAAQDEPGLRAEVERATEATRKFQNRVYCSRLQMAAFVPQLWLAGRISIDEARRWRSWMAAHRESMTCAVLDRDDRLPAMLYGVQLALDALIHPRSTWRQARHG